MYKTPAFIRFFLMERHLTLWYMMYFCSYMNTFWYLKGSNVMNSKKLALSSQGTTYTKTPVALVWARCINVKW